MNQMVANNLSEWSKMVLERDNHTCVICGCPANLADHIKNRRLFPELALDISNGRALCYGCHGEHGARVKLNGKITPGGRRRLYQTGSSVAITLPQGWVRKHGLKAGDEIGVIADRVLKLVVAE